MHTEELVFLPPTFVLGNDEESDFVRCYVGECMNIAMMNFVVAQGCLASVVFHLETLKAHLQSTQKLWTNLLMVDNDRCRKLKTMIYYGYVYDEVAK